MDYTQADMENALRAIASMVERSGKMTFAKGTPQHTLQTNRIAALHVVQALVQSKLGLPNEAGNYTHEELQKAVAPVASLISKSCAKAAGIILCYNAIWQRYISLLRCLKRHCDKISPTQQKTRLPGFIT